MLRVFCGARMLPPTRTGAGGRRGRRGFRQATDDAAERTARDATDDAARHADRRRGRRRGFGLDFSGRLDGRRVRVDVGRRRRRRRSRGRRRRWRRRRWRRRGSDERHHGGRNRQYVRGQQGDDDDAAHQQHVHGNGHGDRVPRLRPYLDGRLDDIAEHILRHRPSLLRKRSIGLKNPCGVADYISATRAVNDGVPGGHLPLGMPVIPLDTTSPRSGQRKVPSEL